MCIDLYVVNKNADITVNFATQELNKYLKKSINSLQINLSNNNEISKTGIYIGMFKDLDIQKEIIADNPKFDDAIYINVKNNNGVISGINPRSVLLAVYRFLYEIGFRWVRPGIKGEFIPTIEDINFNVYVEEKPSYRHRGICIEGAVSFENVYDMIDFIPKISLNSYFIQFKEGFSFFNNWYTHQNNPLKKKEQFTIDKAKEYVAILESEIKKRGLIYHAVGHGWTSEAVGIPGRGWNTYSNSLSEDKKKYLALINEKREFYNNIPLNTNLCYSNPEVRKSIIDKIVEHLKVNKNIDVLHFWLADGFNNHCECDECKKMRPSDYYIKMLNELDNKLNSMGINTKIVFLIYVDLFWPPEKEFIKNKDRFIMMFAPITRTFTESIGDSIEKIEIKPYTRNKLQFPKSVAENLQYLNEWQKKFDGDSFLFDYHYMWEHLSDPGYFKISNILYKDLVNLAKVGLNGYISCQLQRAFLPTGLGEYIMGKVLWNNNTKFDDIVNEYFEVAFGKDGKKCRDYLKKLSDLFGPIYYKGTDDIKFNDEDKRSFLSIPEYIKSFKPIIEKNLSLENVEQRTSWFYLNIHANISTMFAYMFIMFVGGNIDASKQKWNEIKDYIQKNEDLIQPVFDVYQFIKTVEEFLKIV